MTTVQRPIPQRTHRPELHSGDRMTREEFHRLYSMMPESFKAELVEGVVYVASPLRLGHSRRHLILGTLLTLYEGGTPGVQAGDNATVLLGAGAEPQPDLFLRLRPEYGGQSRTSAADYVEGPPELIAEIAYSSRSIDLHAKRRDYQRHGVLEYLVFSVEDEIATWLDLKADSEIPRGEDGVIRVRAFPGLWIEPNAVFSNDHTTAINVLQQGLASPEHAQFVRNLEQRRRA